MGSNDGRVAHPVDIELQIAGDTFKFTQECEIDVREIMCDLEISEICEVLSLEKSQLADYLGKDFCIEHFGIEE